MVDWSKVGTEGTRQAQQHEKSVISRIVRVANAVERRLNHNPNDETVELIEVLLGVMPGGKDKATELLGKVGFTTNQPSAEETGPRALTVGEYGPGIRPHNGDVLIPILDEHGNPTSSTKARTAAEREGYIFHHDEQGRIIGISSRPQPAQAGATEVPVRDKNDKDTGRKVSIAEGNADKRLEAIPDLDGKITHFREKPILIRRG